MSSNKKVIDIEAWPRKEHYKAFLQMERPHFSICTQLDINPLILKKNIKLFPAMLFAIHKASQSVPQFRMRIIDSKVIEFDCLDICFNIFAEDKLFSNHRMQCGDNYYDFQKNVMLAIESKNKNGIIKIDPDQDQNMILTSFIPWFTFSGLSEPLLNSRDSLPRITWSKCNSKGEVSLSIMAHHSLIDGYHVGKMIERLNEELKALANMDEN